MEIPTNNYAAIAKPDGKFYVVRMSKYQTIYPTDFRAFDTFDEADQVAKDTAAGKYGYKPGNYIYMG